MSSSRLSRTPLAGDSSSPPYHASPANPSPPHADAEDDTGLVEHLLGSTDQAGRPDGWGDFRIASWSEDRGMLEDGRVARIGASCLLRPQAGDRVLTWQSGDDCWVLNVLERADRKSEAVIATSAPGLVLRSSRIALTGQAVHIAAEDFLTSTRNRHAVENTRTETCKMRVSQVGTDIRRVNTADEEVSGTLVQRAGTWLSTTARDARLRARTFLFD